MPGAATNGHVVRTRPNELLRFATAAGAVVLVALTDVLSPVVVLWLLAAGLLAQVVFELAAHERHQPAPQPAD